jgi:hypothetical protein
MILINFFNYIMNFFYLIGKFGISDIYEKFMSTQFFVSRVVHIIASRLYLF